MLKIVTRVSIASFILWGAAWGAAGLLPLAHSRFLFVVLMTVMVAYWAFALIPAALLTPFSPDAIVLPMFPSTASLLERVLPSVVVTVTGVILYSAVAYLLARSATFSARAGWGGLRFAAIGAVLLAAIRLPLWDMAPQPPWWNSAVSAISVPTVGISRYIGVDDPFGQPPDPSHYVSAANRVGLHVLISFALLLFVWFTGGSVQGLFVGKRAEANGSRND